MLTLHAGHDVGYLTGAVGGGREGYYTGAVAAGEPAGLWYGAGAEVLGLAGEVDAELMEAVYSALRDPRDPAAHSRATWGEAEPLAAAHRAYRSAEDIYEAALEREPLAGPERRAELRGQAERSARQAVSFIDATFSASKSVSVMGVAFERAANDARAVGDARAAGAWDTHARAVEDAVLAGARAALDYLQDVAGYARVGHHGGGAGRWIDAHRFVVAQFLQHDSRDRDPQLHVHQAILNRVLCADGVWRALDSRAIHTFRAAAAAIGERVMEAHLARSLGVRFETRPDGQAREIIGVRQDVMDLFSSRTWAITAKAEKLIAAFREQFRREPSPLERSRLSQRATLVTRKAKSHDGETLAGRLDRWQRETLRLVVGGLSQVARDVFERAQQAEPAAPWSERDVILCALAEVGKSRASWSRSDLTRAISKALPGNLGIGPEAVRELLDGLTDTALADVLRHVPAQDTTNHPAEFVKADGTSAFEQPGGARYTTRDVVAAEWALRAAAVRRGAATFTATQAATVIARFAESGRELGADQAATVRGVLTSGAQVEVLAAAAGTGKSFTVGALAGAWAEAGHRVFGLAPSQVAAQVLAEEGVTAANTTRWLTTQARLDQVPPGETPHGDDESWRLRRDDLLVVDEAGMATTGDLAEIHRQCAAAGAKLLLVGDPRQLTAVGPGGMLADIAERGVRYELAEVRRFTNDWERRASLALRDGDPTVLAEYDRHGRLIDGGAAEQAEAGAARGWLADTLAGRESLLLVPSNKAAARVSAALRAELVALGRVHETGVPLGMQGTVAGVGDLVQARRNGWELIGFEGNTRAPINRECYRVTGVRANGGLTVAPVHGRDDGGEQLGEPLVLPASYVAEHVTLGYASTVHAAQGRTVDTAHAVIGAGTDAAGAYVALTRGRERNTAWTVTTALPEDAAPGEAHDVVPRSARRVLADAIDTQSQPVNQSALTEQEHAQQVARSTMTSVDQLIEFAAAATAGRTGAALDRLAADGVLTDAQRIALAADEAFGSLEQLLRTAEIAGHDPAAVLDTALRDRSLKGAISPAQALHARIRATLHDQLAPLVTGFADLIPRDVAEHRRAGLEERAEAADARRRELGTETAEAAPQWATAALGSVPADPVARAEWEHRAGWAAAYRELAAYNDETDPLGAPPPGGLAEKRAIWTAAHDALDLPDRSASEAELTEGRLRIRVRAMDREQTWAPHYVADELAATHLTAERHRTDAQVWAARAEVTQDPAEAETLRTEAARAQAAAEALAERATALEAADDARAAWFAATAATRDTAERARVELKARGVDPDDPHDRVTAAEWLEAHHAGQTAEDSHREVRDEHELADDQRPATEAAAEDHTIPHPILETAVADVRDTSVPDTTEAQDPAQLRRVPTADETAAAVARAQTALAEIEARRETDAARDAEHAAAAIRRDELTRWAEQDRATEAAHVTEAADPLVLER